MKILKKLCFIVCIILLSGCNRNINNQLNTNNYMKIQNNESHIMTNEIITTDSIEKLITDETGYFEYRNVWGGTKKVNLIELINEFKTFSQDDFNEICWENISISFIFQFEGGRIPPADMLFFSNSIMVLRTENESPNIDTLVNRFYVYSLIENELSELSIKSIDSRYNPTNWLQDAKRSLENENNRGHIISVDENNKMVVYRIFYRNNNRRGIFFTGRSFFEYN